MDIPTVLEHQKTTCVPNPTEQAMESLGPAYVIANHQPSKNLYAPMTKRSLLREITKGDGSVEIVRWVPIKKLVRVFSGLDQSQIIRFMDNLHNLYPDKYHLFKRLFTTGQESAVTEWNTWIMHEISKGILPHIGVYNTYFRLSLPKLKILYEHLPRLDLKNFVLEQKDLQFFKIHMKEGGWYKNRLGTIYPNAGPIIQDFINSLPDDEFCYMIHLFNRFNPEFYTSWKAVLNNDADYEQVRYYEDMVCSFSSLPGFCEIELNGSHLSSLETHKPILIKTDEADRVLFYKFREPDWRKPELCRTGIFPVVKNALLSLVNSLSIENFERILNIFFTINSDLYESFKNIITNKDSIDDHKLYDIILKTF